MKRCANARELIKKNCKLLKRRRPLAQSSRRTAAGVRQVHKPTSPQVHQPASPQANKLSKRQFHITISKKPTSPQASKLTSRQALKRPAVRESTSALYRSNHPLRGKVLHDSRTADRGSRSFHKVLLKRKRPLQ